MSAIDSPRPSARVCHDIAVELSPRRFCILWVAAMLIRAACIVFLGATTRLYWFMAHPYMSYYAGLLNPNVAGRFKYFGGVFAAVGMAHTFRFLQTIYYSLRLREFVLNVDHHRKLKARSSSMRRVSELLVPVIIQKNAKVGWAKLFARRGFFGVESDFFHARFLFREVVEYVSQTIQVYRSSILIAKPWINKLNVGLMVVNCWSTPILQRAFERNPAIERFLCLALDLVLDMAASMGIPLIIFVPYYNRFEFEVYNFRLENLYDDTWFANMVMENQQIFALTQLDFILKIVPHLSIYSCLSSISVLVRQHGTKRFLVMWGLAILVLHLLATWTSQSLHVPSCKQPTRPWFATKYSCSVLNFNCHRNGSTGVNEDAFDFLEEDSVMALAISHCPKLRIPRSIRRFRNLLGIDIYNSTLLEWSAHASISATSHPALTYIIFVRVNMTELPPGVLQSLPNTAVDVEISISNLTSLPSDLHERWHPMAIFYVEHTLIRDFPSTLLQLSVDDLSLMGNAIEAIPEFPAHHTPKFVALAMSGNPLQALPESLGDTSGLGFLSIDDTLISKLPSWVDSVRQSATTIHAFNTPFCLNKSPDERERDFGAAAVLT
ncbi:hypothetical protein PybrP1_003101 [[Pythium] brassicae (nom. inval.)]|nr:hypothetical protein PybrP1_003101 [[Pythium] brassicae (nom. inval.)]